MMELYSSGDCLDCHRIRFLLAEKGINVRIIDVDEKPDAAADMAELNPYGTTPTLVDRDIVLYGTWVVADYVDERYPHPPLMPIDPISRARLRLAMYRVQRDWFTAAEHILGLEGRELERARRSLRESLTAADELFAVSTYLLSDELSLLDCLLVPFFWRLPVYGINLSRNAVNIQKYIDRVFARESFQRSLTPAERAMREV
ncbi:MAG: stringent starvation protein SspA [Wenzhouxiangellaceae bacterium]